jgi:hypothetical protein
MVPQTRAQLRPPQASPVFTGSMVASLSPALAGANPDSDHARATNEPSIVAADVPHVASRPAPAAPVLRHSGPTAPALRSSTLATVATGKPIDQITDISRPLEIDLGNKQRKTSASSAEEPRKKLNGGKLIYGD